MNTYVESGDVKIEKRITELKIPGCLLIEGYCSNDFRGSFIKFFDCKIFHDLGFEPIFKEAFYTVSCKNTLRGIHFQNPRQQAKLVHCINGRILDVFVDLRRNSPTYGNWDSIEISNEVPVSIYLPEGIGHAYLALEDSLVCYCCTETFYSEDDTGIIWNDPDLKISWPLDNIGGEEKVILSHKDQNLQTFRQWHEKHI